MRPLSALRLLLAFCGFAFLPACTPPEYSANRKPVNKDAVNIDLRDKATQRLYTLRDERRTDSLIAYLKHPQATLRYLAALSFASVRDSAAIEPLTPLLRDGVEDVRIAAAFALGQIGAPPKEKLLLGSPKVEQVLTEAFDGHDSLSQHQRFNAIVLEAVGKCGGAASLKNIVGISTYQPTDTLLLEGQCRAIYRFGLRGLTEAAGTARMVTALTDAHLPNSARLMAAHYLARAKEVSPDSAQSVNIAAALVRAPDPDVRMALAHALGRTKNGPAFGILSKVVKTEEDWRVKCEIIRSLAQFTTRYDSVRSLVLPHILSPNPHVARTAAEMFVSNGQPKDGKFYWRIVRDNPNLPWDVQVTLYRAATKWIASWDTSGARGYVLDQLRGRYLQSKNPYERADCLRALAEAPSRQYRWIHDRGFNDPSPAVKTAAAEALLTIMQRKDFYSIFGENAKGARRELYFFLREIVGSGDAGMIAAAAEGFTAPALNFRTMRDSARLTDLSAALLRLKLPRDYEAYQALAKSIAWLDGKPEPKPAPPAFNHPIDWTLLERITPATRVNLQTSRGLVVMELYPQWAPGSVANFLQLITTNFYDGKSFHRVAPNFVVQGGCPRGDGYGALDYSIRTEIGLAWYDDEGYVGMASAGPDTEGTQFFFTHSPAPHLDGTYTIFGKVTQGMEVVNQLLVGDKIEKATIEGGS